MMMPRKCALLPALLAALSLLVGCTDEDLAAKRMARAATATGDIIVGVSWPFSTPKGALWEGAELAQDEINNSGGILGRKLVMIKEDDKLSVTKGTAIAYKFADNLDMVAVIGTLNSYIAVTTAPVYEFAGMVMLTQGSSVVRLTSQGYKKVFRMIPSNRDVGARLADYARSKHYRRTLIYYVKNEYGLDLANAFERRATEIGLEVTDRVSYLTGAADYKLAMQHWKDFYSFDAIFLAGSLPEGAQIIRAAREIGIKVPIFSGDGLDSPDLIRLGGTAVEGTTVVSFFHPGAPEPSVLEFDKRFRRRFNRLPDTTAALGYDAVKLLAHAMTKAGTTVPEKVAQELHNTKGWQGVTGTHSFDDAGNVLDKPIVIQVVKNGQFAYTRTER